MSALAAVEVDPGSLQSWTSLWVFLVGFAVAAAVFATVGRRSGERDWMLFVPRGLERVTGIPGWAAATVGTAAFGLLVAGVGFYNDVAWHVGVGRDEELFTAPHTMIVLGLWTLALAGAIGIFFATIEERDTRLRVGGFRVPRSAATMLVVGLSAVSGFALDELWHLQFGIDVTMWSPTHLLMIVGASVTPLVSWLVLAEAGVRPIDSWWARGVHVVVALLVLDGLSSVQGEFDFGVPQFQQLYLPVLVVLAGALALVAVRLAHGPGWSLVVVGLMLLTRMGLGDDVGALELSVRPSALYVGSAVAVEAAALLVGTARRFRFALAAAAGVATLGLGVEWLWNQGAHQPWSAALLPDAVLLAALAAVGAALLGAVFGDLAGGRPVALSGRTVVVALVALGVAMAWPYPRTAGDVTAAIEFDRVDEATAFVEAELEPTDAGDGARWFQVTAWQGGGLRLADMEEVAPGHWRSEQPVPVAAPWKTLLRLHRGSEMSAVPLYLPADEEIDGPRGEEFPAVDKTVAFESETRYLLREQEGGSALVGVGIPVLVLLLGGVWIAAMAWTAAGAAAPGSSPRRPVELPG